MWSRSLHCWLRIHQPSSLMLHCAGPIQLHTLCLCVCVYGVRCMFKNLYYRAEHQHIIPAAHHKHSFSCDYRTLSDYSLALTGNEAGYHYPLILITCYAPSLYTFFQCTSLNPLNVLYCYAVHYKGLSVRAENGRRIEGYNRKSYSLLWRQGLADWLFKDANDL